jgi:peptidoglycan/LPS O-acetylase OafA/YrhL
MAIARADGVQQLDKLSASHGQISYGMSLYHMRANLIVFGLLGRHSLWFHVPVVIAVTALLGACSFHIIER